MEAVRLIDEKDAAEGGFYHLVHQRGSVTDIAAYQIRSGNLYQLSAGENADRLEVFADDTGNGRLTGAGIPRENHMFVDFAGF